MDGRPDGWIGGWVVDEMIDARFNACFGTRLVDSVCSQPMCVTEREAHTHPNHGSSMRYFIMTHWPQDTPTATLNTIFV